MKRKKAAIELSVTAIIVLILAIVMLGLGLGFIRGMFGKVSSQIEQQISVEAEPFAPTATNPLTISREVMITHAGEKEILKVSFFNPTNESWTGVPTLNCGNESGELGDDLGIANSKTIKQGEFDTFNVLVTLPSKPASTYLCTMETATGYQKDMAIKIIG